MENNEKNDAIKKIVANIIEDYEQDRIIDKSKNYIHPDNDVIVDILNKLRYLIFAGYYNSNAYKSFTFQNKINMLAEDIIFNLGRQISNVLMYAEGYSDIARKDAIVVGDQMALEFMKQIPKIRAYIDTDVEAGYEGDPAAANKDEIIFSYPGLYAILVYRIAHELFKQGVPIIPRMMTEHAHSRTGIDIHPGATIGKYFFIDHGTGIVIGETTVIGEHVKIYQGVTLGALSTRGGQSLRGTKRHPTIEDYATIYSNASILGGDTVIGKGVTIGGNAFITESVFKK